MLDGDLPKAPTAPASTELQLRFCENFQPAFLSGSCASQRATKWDGIMPWVQTTLGLRRSRFSSPSYPKSAQLQSPSDDICTASRNLARALIVQPACSWNHGWFLPQQYLELWMSLSLSRSPGILGLHEEGWKALLRYWKGPNFHPRECSAPAVLYQCEERRRELSLHLGVYGDEDQTSS